MMTKRWIWLAVAATLIAAGCNNDKVDSSGGAAGGGGGGGKAVPKVSLPPGSDRLLAALPLNADIVLSIDAGRLRSSPVITKLLDAASKANTTALGFDINAECGLDPAKVVGTALIGVKMTSADNGDISVAFSGLEKIDLVACIEKARPKIEANNAKVTIDGNYVFITTTDDGKQAYLGMTKASDGIGVLRMGKTPVDKAALDQMASARPGAGLTGSADFMTMVGATNTKATVWGLANGGSPMLSRGAIKFQSAFGAIDVTDGIDASGRIRVKSADEAQKLIKMFGGQLNSIKQMGFADVAEMKPDGQDILITFKMKPQQVENIMSMAMLAFEAKRGGAGMANPNGPAPQPAPPPEDPANP